jgi:hypothetical protein
MIFFHQRQFHKPKREGAVGRSIEKRGFCVAKRPRFLLRFLRSDTLFVCRRASSVDCRMAGKAVYARQDRVRAGHNGTTKALDS